MTLDEAQQLHPGMDNVEAINQILKHAGLIFEMTNLEDELDELIEEMKLSGTDLCPHCGFICSGQCEDN